MDRIEDLANRARQWTVDRTGADPVPEIEALLAEVSGVDLARLHEARAAAVQSDSPQLAADDSLAAAAIYAREGMPSHAAALAAAAAALAEMAGDWPGALERAVAATVQLSDVELDDAQTVRASAALSMFYGHMAAFELAVPFARRAVDASVGMEHPGRVAAMFNLGYLALEAVHSRTGTEAARARWRESVTEMATMLRSIDDPVTSRVLGGGLAAEAALLDDDLETATAMVTGTDEVAATAGPLIQPWFSFVRACVARRHGDLERADELLTTALPGLEATADDHCRVRALAERSIVRELRGDTSGALTDSRVQADLVRRWQVDRVEQFAQLVAAQAELERDGSLLRRQAGELVRAATEDPLTGLYSRRWLSRRIAELEALDSNGSILLVDIDHFKVVNDTHGHGVGDRVLAAVGDVLRASFRDGDVVRYGGEEFLVPLLTDALTAAAIAERARMAITHASFDEIVPDLRLTISVGVSSGSLARVRELIDAADDALYVAKQSGRNRVVTADPLT